MQHSLRQHSAVAITTAIAFVVFATSAAATPSAAPKLTLWVGIDRDAHCGRVEIAVQLYGDLRAGTTDVQAQQIARQYRPKPGTVSLTLNARSYRLAHWASNDSASSMRVTWGLRGIAVNRTVAKQALGKAATLTYMTMSGANETLHTRAKTLGCG
jgi:hypothetical protein